MSVSLRPAVALGINEPIAADDIRDGQLQLCAVGVDGALYRMSQVAASNGWSGWSSSGTAGGALFSAVSMGVSNFIDRPGLGAYAVADDTKLYSQTQPTADDGWGPLSVLGSPVSTSPTKVVGAGGTNYLFAIRTDGTLQLQIDNSPSWVSHPGAFVTGTPGVGASLDGRLEVFAVGSDGTLFHKWQLSGGGQQDWSNWFSHGAPLATALAGSPAIASSDGRLAVFVVGWDGALYHIRQPDPDGGWSGWTSHGTPQGTTLQATPSLALGPDGGLEVFVVGWNGSLYHIKQVPLKDDWSGWLPHGAPPGTTLAGPPSVAPSADDRLEVFVVGSDGSLYHIWQPVQTDDWSAWFSHGTP